jgi:hypothetical protein
MPHIHGADRKARMARQVNTITVGLAVTGAAASGVLMVSAAAQSPASTASATSTDTAATTASTNTSDGGSTGQSVLSQLSGQAASTDDSLRPAQDAVTTTDSRPAATSGGS